VWSSTGLHQPTTFTVLQIWSITPSLSSNRKSSTYFQATTLSSFLIPRVSRLCFFQISTVSVIHELLYFSGVLPRPPPFHLLEFSPNVPKLSPAKIFLSSKGMFGLPSDPGQHVRLLFGANLSSRDPPFFFFEFDFFLLVPFSNSHSPISFQVPPFSALHLCVYSLRFSTISRIPRAMYFWRKGPPPFSSITIFFQTAFSPRDDLRTTYRSFQT